MELRQLGNTDIKVSIICLGTMTWGVQNTQNEAFEQMDYAISQGVNFFDTAELYAIPPKPDTYGTTEIIIGNWFEQKGNREKVILATKMTGPRVSWIREGRGIVAQDLESAINGSLKRLKTDYIDLYQLHWPQRTVQLWGKENYHESMVTSQAQEQLEEFFVALANETKKGKIRYIGLSNETAWGAMQYQKLAKKHNLPQIVSIQNAYSIVRREYEIALAEIAMYEKIGLLAYSPLAGGLLSGKYKNGAMPESSRFKLFPDTMGYYNNEKSNTAVTEYQKLADEMEVSLTQFCLAFVNNRQFVTSNIIGATTMDQLKENINSIQVNISPEMFKKIEQVFKNNSNPGNW